MTLKQITEALLLDIENLKDRFYSEEPIPETKEDFTFVKSKTSPIFDRLSKWEDETLAYIQANKSVVHFNQVIATKENIELLIVHGYFKDMRKRRFMEYYQSSQYVLKNLNEEL